MVFLKLDGTRVGDTAEYDTDHISELAEPRRVESGYPQDLQFHDLTFAST